MDAEKKEALHIVYMNENNLTIRNKWKTIEIVKYGDCEVEFEITDEGEKMAYIFDKKQIQFLAKWLTS
jgi:hypothetical protein